ncbi:MAG: hypothetical protein MMC33_009589 [Icmadophila ericetorum]|nr:hypothetical protein [Icmadophila ericetorum]
MASKTQGTLLERFSKAKAEIKANYSKPGYYIANALRGYSLEERTAFRKWLREELRKEKAEAIAKEQNLPVVCR